MLIKKARREMDEGTVRQAANMFALVADMEAVKARVEGMKAENGIRESLGHSLAYDSEHFAEAEKELSSIGHLLRTNG